MHRIARATFVAVIALVSSVAVASGDRSEAIRDHIWKGRYDAALTEIAKEPAGPMRDMSYESLLRTAMANDDCDAATKAFEGIRNDTIRGRFEPQYQSVCGGEN